MTDEHDQPLELGLEEETDPGAEPEGSVTIKIAQEAYDLNDPPEDLDQRRMFSITLIQDLMTIERDLLERDDVTDVKLVLDEPAPEFTISTIENSLGRELPRDIKSFYRVLNGFELSWSRLDEAGNKSFGGHMQIMDISRVFGFWFDTIWVDDPSRSEQELDLLWSTRGIDQGPDGPQGPLTALRLLGDWGSDYELLLFHSPDRVSLLNMDLMSYIYYGLETRGLGKWRHIVSGLSVSEPDLISVEQVRGFLTDVAHLFPEVDLEEYRALVPKGI